MLKFKKTPGKIREKIVFKFQFHVTRVPQAGWSSLKVSLIPQDTGRRSNKTVKGFVEYGCCRWPDPIVESTKLLQDIQSGRYDDKFYKLVVGARSKVLGEVTINLADFANAASHSVALPLQNCRGNTLLHAKIYSLTSLKKTRELSVQDEASSESEEEEEEVDNQSVASSTSQALSGPIIPKSISSPRETASRYSTDTPMSPKEETGSVREFYIGEPPSPSSSVYSRRRRFSQGSFPSIQPEPSQLPRASSSGLQMNELAKLENETPRSVRSLSFRKAALEQESPVSEKTVQELRMEAVTWQRRARAMSLEVQKMKQDLGSVMRQKVGDTSVEMLKLELQSAKQAHEASEEKLRKEVDEVQRSLASLKTELAYEKEANSNMNVQFRKSQDSNMQLVLAIQDMEESLEEQRREMEQLSSVNQKLEVSVYEAKTREQNLEKEWLEKLASKDELIKDLHERSDSSSANKSFQDMEKELRELTDENMELLFKLSKATRELESRTRLAVASPRFEGSPDREEVDRLKSMIVEQEKKLAATEEFHQLQHSSNEKLMARLQTLIQGLKKANVDLESQVRASELEMQSLNSQLEREKATLEEAKDRSTQEEGRLNTLLVDMKACKAQLESRVATLAGEAQEHERNMVDTLKELESVMVSVRRLEERVLQLEMVNNGLEMKIQDSQDLDKLNKLQIHELEAQVSTFAKDLGASEGLRKQLECRVETLTLELDETNKMLRSEQEHSQQQVDELMSQLLSGKLDLEKSTLINAGLEEKIARTEMAKQEVELQLGRSRTEHIELCEKLTKMEAETRFLDLEVESSKQQLSKAQSKLLESEKQRVVMAAALNEYKSKWIELSAHREKDMHAQRMLDHQLETVKAEASKHLAAKEVLKRQVQELQEGLKALEKDHSTSTQKLEAQVIGLKQENEQILDRELVTAEKLNEKLNSVSKELELCTQQKVEAEHVVLKREKEIVNLQTEFEDSENNYTDLEVKLIVLEAECNRLKLEQNQVQEKVLKLEAENESIIQARRDLETDVKTLTDEAASHQRSEENLLNRVSEAEESFMSTLEKVEACRREKSEADELAASYSATNKTLQAALEKSKDLQVKMESQRNADFQTRRELEVKLEKVNHHLQDNMNSKIKLEQRIVELGDKNSQLEKLNENLTASVGSLEALLASLSSSLASKEQEKEALLRSLEEENLHAVEYGESLKAKMEELSQSLASLMEEKVKLQELVKQLEHDKDEFETKVAQQYQELNDLLKDHMNSEQRITELGEKNCQLEKLNSDLTESVKSLEALLTSLRSSLASKEQENKVLLRSVEEEKLHAAKHGERLTTKTVELSESLASVMQEKIKLQELAKQREHELETKVAQQSQDLNELRQDHMNSKINLEQRITELGEKKYQLEKQNEDLTESVESLEALLTSSRSSLASKEQEKEVLLRSVGEEKLHAAKYGERLKARTEELSESLASVMEEKVKLQEVVKQLEYKKDEFEMKITQQDQELKEAGKQLEQSRAKLLKLKCHAMRNVETMSVANAGCALKLAKCEQEVLRQGKLLEQNTTELDSSFKVMSENDEQPCDKQPMKSFEKMALIQARLRDLHSKLDAEQAKAQDDEESPLVDLLTEQRVEEVHEKLMVLEACVTRQLEALRQEYEEKEMNLQSKVDYLETTIGRQMDAGLEQFQVEVTRLQRQLSLCSQRERELVSKLNSQEILEKEIRRLQQDNEQLVDTIARLKAASEWDDVHARIVVLETELSEALEANAAYKLQLELG